MPVPSVGIALSKSDSGERPVLEATSAAPAGCGMNFLLHRINRMHKHHNREEVMAKLGGMVLAMSLFALPVAHAQTVDTKADVQKLTVQWMNAYNSQDAAGVAKMYAPD